MDNPTPKFRPVFGQKYPSGFRPVTPEAEKPRSSTKPTTVPFKKLKPNAWPDYFAMMNTTERILFAFTVFRQPKDESVNQFCGYNHDSFRILDKDLPGPSYQEVTRILTKWTKLGFMEVGGYSNSLSLKEGVARAFWKFINQQTNPVFMEVEPDQVYPADLTGTLDNLFNFLVMVEQGEVLVTLAQEINKHSLKRILSSLNEPVRPHKLFNLESYFFWLLGFATFFQLIGRRGDRLVLTTPGRELPEHIKVEDLLCEICPMHFHSIENKGFFVMLPLLARCTTWTSWGHMVSGLIPGDDSFNLLRQDRVISILDPLRFLGFTRLGRLQR